VFPRGVADAPRSSAPSGFVEDGTALGIATEARAPSRRRRAWTTTKGGLMELERDRYGQVSYDPVAGVLELQWFESTGEMTDEDVRRALERLAAHAEERRAANVLIDVTSSPIGRPRTSAPGGMRTSFPATTQRASRSSPSSSRRGPRRASRAQSRRAHFRPAISSRASDREVVHDRARELTVACWSARVGGLGRDTARWRWSPVGAAPPGSRASDGA
jgi:hypothetical protein